MCSLGFQHQGEIDAFAFRDVETTDCEESPAFGWVCEKFARDGRRQNNKTRIGCAHEFTRATLVQRREKTLDTGPKIPDQTWLLELDRSKLHVRLQRVARHLEELIRGEKPRHHWRKCERNRDPNTCSNHGEVAKREAMSCIRR